MSLTDLTLNGVVLSTACPEVVVKTISRPLGGDVRDEYTDVPGRAGAWVFPEEPGDLVLTVDVAVLVDTIAQRRAAVRKLSAWAATPDGRVALVVSDEPDRFWDVKLAAAPPMADDEYEGVTQLAFRASPYALSTATFTEEIVGTAGNAAGTITLPDDVYADPIIELDPDGTGYIDTFTLTVNDDTLSVLESFDVNEVVTVSSLSDTVTAGVNVDVNLTGAFDPDQVRMSDVSGGFPQLVPGDNDITLQWDGSATTVIVRVIWRRRFL